VLTDAVVWICRSPRRLAVTAVTVIAVVLLGSSLLTQGGGDSDRRAAAPVAQVPDAERYVRPAVTFVRDWAQLPDGGTPEQWHARLAPLATPELAEALRTTDPAELPGTGPQGEPVVRYLAQASALIAVPLANGSSVLVTVVDGSEGALVSDIQPDAGD
jgi:hypothetical protein